MAQLLGEEYKTWRTIIRARNQVLTGGDFCNCCDSLTKDFEIHHLDPYDLYPEEGLDLSNGVLLCKPCHKAYHDKYPLYKISNSTYQKFRIERRKPRST